MSSLKTDLAPIQVGAATTGQTQVNFYPQFIQNKMVQELATSGAGVAAATIATNPIEVVKVRLQLNTTGGPGMMGTFGSIYREEGIYAFAKGMQPAITRGVVYGGLRFGLYSPIKEAIVGEGQQPNFAQKLSAGMLSGGLAAAATNPFDLVKTRLQTGAVAGMSQSTVVRQVMADSGVLGFWKGVGASSSRAAVLTAAQCATYDEIKRKVMHLTGMGDHIGTHFSAAMVAGLISTTATSPFDVIKTKMFVDAGRYKNMLQCAQVIAAQEGALGFMKGWTANYVRLGPQTTITFLVVELLRSMMGMDTF